MEQNNDGYASDSSSSSSSSSVSVIEEFPEEESEDIYLELARDKKYFFLPDAVKGFRDDDDNKYTTKDIESNRCVHVAQDLLFQPGTSGAVWPSAWILCEFLCNYDAEHGSEIFRDVPILELGTGTGMVGMVAAMLGARVVVTDMGEDELVLAKKNVNAPRFVKQLEERGGVIGTASLLWGDADMLKRCISSYPLNGQVPEIVLGSDLVFDIACIGYLAKTIGELQKMNRNQKVFLSFLERDEDVEDDFFAALKKEGVPTPKLLSGDILRISEKKTHRKRRIMLYEISNAE